MSYASDSTLRIGVLNRGKRIWGNDQIWRKAARLSGTTLLGLGLAVLPARAQDQQQNMPYPPAASTQPQAEMAPAADAPANFQQVPQTLVVPAGTVISVRLSQYLSSDQNHPGDLFSVTLDQPLVVDGWVVARQGQSAYGKVSIAQKAKAGGGNSRLGVELSQLTLVDGQQIPVQTQLSQASGGGPDVGQSVATVATTTGMGAIIGAAADWGRGDSAGIGAAAGAAAGMLVVLLTPGKPTVMPAEAVLNFQLMSPLAVSTVRSQVAFQPVSQQDYARPQNYDRYRDTRRPEQRVVVAPPYWYGFGWGWGNYPIASFGYYGGYRPRVIFGGRFGHGGHHR